MHLFATYFHRMILNLLLILTIVSNVNSAIYKDSFNEELLIKPLSSGHVYAYFQFTTTWQQETDLFEHCHLFPRALGEIIARFNVQELHMSLTEGLWRYDNWGYPIEDAAPGAELWAWFKSDTPNIDKNWRDLANALSGLFCASLNFIDPSKSLSPAYSFRPTGIMNEKANSSFLRYATLPREIVCTENLTPWKKLLPCDSMKGLASLLNSANIHNTNYHSLGIHLRPICLDVHCIQKTTELKQTISLVYDPFILRSRDWSLRLLFGMGLSGSCALADSTMIYVDTTHNQTDEFVLNPLPTTTTISKRGGHVTPIAMYDIKNTRINGMLNIAGIYRKQKILLPKISPPIYASRYIVGYGQERGGVVTEIYNNHFSELNIIFLENIPWFMPIYLHTMKITCNGKDLRPKSMKYVPGRERKRPYYLELLLTIPPKSITKLSIDFDYVFLKWQEYPPDANHGFYVGSAVITSVLSGARNYTGLPQDGSLISSSFNASRQGYLVQLRTESFIITLPTPDFSMPYNVICLSCTVVALAFGPLHNITTKRLLLKSTAGRGLIGKLKEKLGCLKRRCKPDSAAVDQTGNSKPEVQNAETTSES